MLAEDVYNRQTQLKAELGADLAKLLNRLDARGALHHLLLGSRHSSSPFLFLSLIHI